MQKIFKFLLMPILALCCMFSLAACDSQNNKNPTYNSYNIYFETNGGSKLEPLEFVENNYPDFNAVPKPTKYGYSFFGWYLDKELTRRYSIYDNSILYNADFTLYAKWEDSYLISFELFGGIGEEFIYIDKNEDYKDVFFGELPIPTKENYIFKGWYFSNNFDEIAEKNHIVIENTTLYAKWAKAYVVSFNTNGGSQLDSIKVAEGDYLNMYEIQTPVKNNYVFDAWYIDELLSTQFDEAVISDVTLYAKWVDALTICFNTNGGSIKENIIIGKGHKLSQLGSEPFKTDYLFYGWYMDKALTQKFESCIINDNLTIYVKWITDKAIILSESNFETYFSIEEECQYLGESSSQIINKKLYSYIYKISLKENYIPTSESCDEINISLTLLLYPNTVVTSNPTKIYFDITLNKENNFTISAKKHFDNFFQQNYWKRILTKVDGYIVLN